jgi:hypothetical protein
MRLHSAYEPVKEAERFLTGMIPGGQGAPLVLIAGPGLGFLYEALLNLSPSADSVLFFHDEHQRQAFLSRIMEAGLEIPPCWSPDEPSTPEEFLLKVTGEWDVGRIMLIEWPPAVKTVDRILHEKILLSIKQGIEYHKKNLVTTGQFGFRWLSNCLVNWLRIDRTAGLSPDISPVVIAASGPSLKESEALLTRYRDRYRMWALPSSLPFLARAGLKPDLVVLTDPGWWAGLHYRNLPAGVPLLLALTALPPDPSILSRNPIVCFSQKQFWEQYLTAAVPSLFPVLPPHGTVAGTAFQLAKSIGSREIVFAGLDFAFRDIQAHVRPHPFECFEMIKTDRLHPHEGLLGRRAWTQAPHRIGSGERTGPVLSAYSDWFRQMGQRNLSNQTTGRLNPSSIDMPGFKNMGQTEMDLWPVIPPLSPPGFRELPEKNKRIAIVKQMIVKLAGALETLDLPTPTAAGRLKKLFSDKAFFDILYPMETASVIHAMRLFREGSSEAATGILLKARNNARQKLKKWENPDAG